MSSTTPNPTQTASARTPGPGSLELSGLLPLTQPGSQSFISNGPALSFLSQHMDTDGATVSSTQQQQQQQQPPRSFPNHQIFTFIPQIYESVTRLRVYRDTVPSQSQPQTQGHQNTQHPNISSSNASAAANSVRAPTSSPVQTRGETTNNLTKTTSKDSTRSQHLISPSLETKELPEKIYEIKQAIQHARDLVHNLPDIERSLEAQQHEISRLEDRVKHLKARLGVLARLALADSSDDPRDKDDNSSTSLVHKQSQLIGGTTTTTNTITTSDADADADTVMQGVEG